MRALSLCRGVHRVPIFVCQLAFMTARGVGLWVGPFVVLATAEVTSLEILALVGGVVEAPAVSALGDGGSVLEGLDCTVSSECC